MQCIRELEVRDGGGGARGLPSCAALVGNSISPSIQENRTKKIISCINSINSTCFLPVFICTLFITQLYSSYIFLHPVFIIDLPRHIYYCVFFNLVTGISALL